MVYKKRQFVNGEIYHLVVKGVEEKEIFKDIDDHYRGIFSIYEFNNAKQITIRERRRARMRLKEEMKKVNQEFPKILSKADRGLTSVDSRDKLVEVLAFCFMPNHFHLLIRQLKEGGISKFMAKLGTGYGGYFNRKYSHQGHVFQRTFTAIHIENEEQLKIVFTYIHTNPLSLIEPKWKELGIKDPERAIKFLEKYKWSSYLDYIGKKNFPSVTDREFILKIMEGEEGCKNFVESWTRYKGEIKKYAYLSLE